MTQQSEWIGKTEAAKRLKISERTVLNLAQEGRIKSKRERDDATNQLAVKFLAIDVERYGYERDNPTEKAQAVNGWASTASTNMLLGPVSSAHPIPTNPGANIPSILAHHTRGKLTERHSTEHYRIKEWVQPAEDSPFHKFVISGPGAEGRIYIALTESCGHDLIRGLEAAYRAGLQASGTASRTWLTVEDASVSSGLPSSVVQAMIESGKLPAIDLDNGKVRKGGGRVGGRWRLRVQDLNAIEGERITL